MYNILWKHIHVEIFKEFELSYIRFLSKAVTRVVQHFQTWKIRSGIFEGQAHTANTGFIFVRIINFYKYKTFSKRTIVASRCHTLRQKPYWVLTETHCSLESLTIPSSTWQNTVSHLPKGIKSRLMEYHNFYIR